MITLSEKDIDINFRSKLSLELQEIESRLPALKDTFEKLKLNGKSKIEVGSRVRINYENGSHQEGRVHNVKYDGTIQINRDGYKSLLNKYSEDLQNLSVGTYGQLEKEIWLLETKKEEITDVINNSEIPDIMLSTKDNIVYVARINDTYYFQDLDIVHAKDLNSYRITLPARTISKLGYYQIRCNASDLVAIYASSEFAFENYYNKSLKS